MKLLSRAARAEMDDNHPVFLFDGTVGRRRSWRSDRIHSRRSNCLAKERQVHLLVESAFGFERRHFDTTRRMSSSPRLQMEYVFVVFLFFWLDFNQFCFDYLDFPDWPVCNKWFHSGEQFSRRPCDKRSQTRITFPGRIRRP